MPGDARQRSHPRTRTQPMLASERSRGARLSTMRTTIVHALDELASLHTHPPFDCGLRSVSMTRSTMSLQGQAEQPMMLRGRGVYSTVPDAPAPWPWTRAVGRVWFAAGRFGSKRSRTSAQLCGMLAWWAPRHGGVALPRQWRPSAGHIGPLARGIRRFERVKGAGAGHSPRPATSPNRPKTRGRAAGCWSRSRPVCDLSCNHGGFYAPLGELRRLVS